MGPDTNANRPPAAGQNINCHGPATAARFLLGELGAGKAVGTFARLAHREGSGAWLSAAFGRGFCDATYDSSESGIGCGAAERESSSSRQTSTRVSQDQVGFARALDVFWQRNPTG